ncbi:MAG: RsmB/NOP family class I SAM-dependent RNA methyltransferase [Opitutaceae bacterium]|nr:RsmB/NOP family class I SAM-dependent RNA methyltransferase [Opitutaceae bacterium]
MSDSAALNHAAKVLAAISADRRADTALRFYFEDHRYLQPPARRAISHAVFVYFRWLSWLDPKASPQKRLEQAADLHERFTMDSTSLKSEALAARAVPAWIWDELSFKSQSGTPANPAVDISADLSAKASATVEAVAKPETTAKAEYLRQLQHDPALWLRARPGTVAALAKSLFACERTDRAPDALRFTGVQDLFKTEQFKTGEFEIQDLASQLVGLACAPRPGETWWDACAGEGGKTLHLADLMQNKGVVWATDRHTGRLDTLKRRAARAKLFNYRTALWEGLALSPSTGSARLPTKTKFDGILLDAPCSGVGTWQRNPHARWTVTPDDVRELAAAQLALLNHVAGSLKPGGRLIYAVCTLTRSETTAVTAAFTAAHPELEPVALPDIVAGVADPGPGATSPATITLWPHELNANGMFIAAWRRKS